MARKASSGVSPHEASGRDPSMRPWIAIARTYFLCDALMARRLGALDVRTAEHEVLVNLQRDPGIAQQTLARRIFTAKSHVSVLLTGLEARGWVRREADPADARARKLFLTAAGARMVRRTSKVQDEVAAAMAATVSATALADMTAALDCIGGRLQALLDSPDRARAA
jgi:DNA-binding MarR family transcriptional regulator